MESVVFKNGNSMAVRLVGECRLPRGTRVREYRDGDRIIIEAIGGWPKSFLRTLGAWNEEIERPAAEVASDPFGSEGE